MVIYLTLLITVLCIVTLYIVPTFRCKVAWWEAALMLIANILTVAICKTTSESTQVVDTEYLIENIMVVEHHEYWNEWIIKECEECETIKVKKRKDGTWKTREKCVSYDCSYMDEHSPYTVVITESGKKHTFYEGFEPNGGGSPIKYNEALREFRTGSIKVNSHINDLYKNYGNRFQGNTYKVTWDKKVENSMPYIWKHTYENRVQASSNNIEGFEPVDTSEIRRYGVYDYPEIYYGWKMKSILGYDNPELEKYLNQKNAKIGKDKQLKVFYLVFYDKPLQAAKLQQRHWGGGNKNEANICIGVDSKTNTIQWSYIFSWSRNETFKVEIIDYINSQKRLDSSFHNIIDYTVNNLSKNFKRREFAEFNYLTVEPSGLAIKIAFILTCIVSIGGSIWIVTNRYDADNI